MEKSGIYKIVNNVNGKFYIGSSVNLRARRGSHFSMLRRGNHRNQYLQRAYDKHGEGSFRFEIIFNCHCSDVLEWEQHFIDEECPDYNIGPVGGGNTWVGMSEELAEERKKSISIGIRRYWEEGGEELRKECSEKSMGELNPNYGNRWSEDLRAHVSGLVKKRYRENPKYREALSEVRKKYWEDLSDDEREMISKKRSERYTGEGNPFYGKSHTEESKDKARKTKQDKYDGMSWEDRAKITQARPLIVDGVHYHSIRHAKHCIGVSETTIYNRLRSSGYPNYLSLDPNIVCKPLKKTCLQLLSPSGGVSFCFPSKYSLSEFLGVHPETVCSFKNHGFAKSSKYSGWCLSKPEYMWTKPNPHLRGL